MNGSRDSDDDDDDALEDIDLDDPLDGLAGLTVEMQRLRAEHRIASKRLLHEISKLVGRVTWLLIVLVVLGLLWVSTNSGKPTDFSWLGGLLVIGVAIGAVVGLVALAVKSVRGTARELRAVRAEWRTGTRRAALSRAVTLVWIWVLITIVLPFGGYLWLQRLGLID